MTLERSKSRSAFARAESLFPGGVNSPVRAFRGVGGDPFVVERGEGAYLVDLDGNRYVDFICSWGPLVLGHAPSAVREAISNQCAKGTSFGACHELEYRLGAAIQRFYPSLEMMRFVNSGTEAGMSVLRLARAFTGRNKILKFAGCYHGHVDSLLVKAGSGSLTLGLPDSAGVPESFASQTLTAEFNDLESVRRILSRCGDEIAAVLIEPVVGNCGFLRPEREFLSGLRELCTKHGTLLVFDEVMTGFRVDIRGAQGLFDIRPDLTMMGKVIGGGLPVGAFGGRKEIMQKLAPLGPVYQAGTLSGNPLAMAAGLATLETWTSGMVFEETARATAALSEMISSEAGRRGIPLVSDALGTMFGFFFSDKPVRNYTDALETNRQRFNTFFWSALENGVYFAPSAFEAGFVSHAHCGQPMKAVEAAVSRAMDAVAATI